MRHAKTKENEMYAPSTIHDFGKCTVFERSQEGRTSWKCNFFNEYGDACLVAFIETWFDSSVSDHGTFIEGFGCPTQLDRDKEATGKKERGGVVCLYVNERWGKNMIVRDWLCTPDIELLTVSLWSLPREFPQLFVTVVYTHTPEPTWIDDLSRDTET